MSSESIDYSPLLPKALGPTLEHATAAWNALGELQNAILLPLFSGVEGFQPDVFAVRKAVNLISVAPISLCQDISTYGQLFSSIVEAVKDRDAIATSLQTLVKRWRTVDTGEISSAQSEIARLLQYDATALKKVFTELAELTKEILAWTSSSVNPIFDLALFQLLAPILEPFATFPSTPDGLARLASILDLPLHVISVPLTTAFHKPLIGKPETTPEVVSLAIQNLQSHICGYFLSIDKVVDGVDPLVQDLLAVSSDALLIPEGIDAFAAGESEMDPVDVDAAVKDWRETKSAADAYVRAISGQSSASAAVGASGFVRTYTDVFTIRRSATPAIIVLSENQGTATSTDVGKVLGVPYSTASSLAALANQTLKTSAQIENVLMHPFDSELKVTVDGTDVSLVKAIRTTKSRYQDIQRSTIPVVRDIQTYSLLQKTIFSILKNDQGTEPKELFDSCADLALLYGAKTERVVAELRSLLADFRCQADSLRSNLSVTKSEIISNKKALAEAQKEYDGTKAELLIDRVLAHVFTVEAIAALYAGKGGLVQELGGKADQTLTDLINKNLKADKLEVLINRIGRVIDVQEQTADRLDEIISSLVSVIETLTQVGGFWVETNASIAKVQKEYSAWDAAHLITTDLITTLIAQWRIFEGSALQYMQNTFGIVVPTTTPLYAAMVADLSAKDLKDLSRTNSTSNSLRHYYGIVDDIKLRELLSPTTSEGSIEKYKLVVASAMDDQLYNALKAPQLKMTTNRKKLTSSAEAYRQAASDLDSLYPEGANDARKLASDIHNTVIPSVTGVVDFYKDFADREISALSVKPTKAKLEDLAAVRAKAAAEGNTKAQASQRVVLNFKNNSDLAYNKIVQKNNELQQQYNIAQRMLQEKKDELAKYDWIKWIPGIGMIIKLIIEAITNTEREIARLESEMFYLSQAMMQLTSVRGIEDLCVSTINSLTQSWAVITQETSDLSAYLKLIHEVPATAGALADSAKETWESLNNNLAQW